MLLGDTKRQASSDRQGEEIADEHTGLLVPYLCGMAPTVNSAFSHLSVTVMSITLLQIGLIDRKLKKISNHIDLLSPSDEDNMAFGSQMNAISASSSNEWCRLCQRGPSD